jgi:hypothetical protein
MVSTTQNMVLATARFGVIPVAPGPVSAIIATDATPNSITVGFTPPSTGGTVSYYEYRVDGGTPVNIGAVPLFFLGGLSPETTYTIGVRATGPGGTSAWTSAPLSTTALPLPPDPPTAVTQGARSATAVSVSWTPPVGGTAVTNYRYRINGGTAISLGLVTSYTVQGLEPSTSYLFEVASENANGSSAWMPLTIQTLAPPPPAADTPSCFSAVRGSAIRVTGLTGQGHVPDLVEYVTSKSVIRVSVTDVVETGGTEVIKNPDEKRRLRLHKNAQTIRHKVDIEFLRVDPEMLRLVAGVELVYKTVAGFGQVPFGIAPFGGGPTNPDDFGVIPFGFEEFGGGEGEEATRTLVGFDVGTTLRATSFALEVWSKLDGASAKPRALGFDEVPFDTTPFDTPAAGGAGCRDGRRWGYTLFPFLRGGRLSGFKFANGLVSFNLIGAQTRRNSGWGVGPYDLTGPFQRLVTPVSRNTSWRMFVTEAAPPAETCGIQYLVPDVLDNGTAANPMPDPDAPLTVDAGGASTEPWIIDGGRA